MKNSFQYFPCAVAAAFALALPAYAIEAPSHDAPPAPATVVPSEPAPGVGKMQAEEKPGLNGGVEAMPARPEPAVTYLGLGTCPVPGFLGKHIGLAPNTGLLVRTLDPEGPAAKAGFAEDDVLVKVDGKEVTSHGDLADLVRAKKPGDSLKIDYIHEGKPGNRSVVLCEHHYDQAVIGGAMPDAGMLKNMLESMPGDQAKEVREAIERRMKDMGNLRFNPVPGIDGFGVDIPGDLKDMGKRMEKMMENAGAAAAQGMKRNEGKGSVQLGFSSTVRLLDNDGSVELKNKDGGNEIRVLDKAGKEVWSGPWDTEQDKAAAPKDIRERISRLNLDSSFKGNGIRLRGAFGGAVNPVDP